MASLLIDTNLLLLLIIGSVEPRLIAQSKRLSDYDVEDFNLLYDFIGDFDPIVTTPNIATETSNLLSTSGIYGDKLRASKQILKKVCCDSLEYYHPSSEVVRSPSFERFGITDTAILQIAHKVDKTITSDFDLYNALISQSLSAQNFRHLRNF